MPNQTLCHRPDRVYSTQCTLNEANGTKIIILSYDSKSKRICTMKFDPQSFEWILVQNDNLTSPGPGGSLMSFENQTKILYLGGFDSNGNKLRTVYELKDDDLWHVWPEKLTIPIGNDTVVRLDPGFVNKCKTPSLSIGNIPGVIKV